MTIDASKELKNFKGEALKDDDQTSVTLGKAIASVLITSKTAGKMKSYVLAQRFYDSKKVELDEADLELVRSEVEKSEAMGNLVLGQVLVMLGEAK